MQFRITLSALTILLLTTVVQAENWPRFRGPNADGLHHSAKLPTNWSESDNVVWKSETPGKGHSSPVIWEDQIWMGTAMNEGHDLHAICFNRDGKLKYNVKLFHIEKLEASNSLNSFASPTPVIEAGTVYLYFGTYGVAAIETASGKIKWSRQDINLNHQEGPGSSPILYKGLLIFHCDGYDVQHITALDKQTGKTVWATTRSLDLSHVGNHARKAFVTPVVRKVNGKDLLVSPAAQGCYAYDPNTGEEVWRIAYSGFSAVPQPVFHGKLAYIVTDFGRPEIWAVDVSGKGVLGEKDIKWKYNTTCPSTPSLIIKDGLIYFVADKTGVASCITADTGELVWRERIGGSFSTSPVATSDHIYFFDRTGATTVVKLGREYKVASRNTLESGCMASPAIADDQLFVRTATHLYCLGQSK
jgi:outer membrane protein assembly factor BamB|tara:strand:- start:2752 stop:3999 length:1248 start_codon:yes stop_codon:yes gene_type:complete